MSSPDGFITSESDAVTVLVSKSEQRKRFTVDGKADSRLGKFFDVHSRRVDGVDALHGLLISLNDFGSAFVIRGEPVEGEGRGIVRRSKDRYDQPATFREAAEGRRWVCLDVDDVPFEGEPGSADSVRRCIRSALPGVFHRSGCAYQWSSSAGLDGWKVFKLHLWFWLDRPVCDGAMSEWMRGSAVDPSLFRTVQPHYTAAPAFDGIDDPVSGCRVGKLDGAGTVAVPWLVPTAAQYQEQVRREEAEAKAQRDALIAQVAAGAGQHRGKGLNARKAAGIIRRAVKAIADAPEGKRHDAIFTETASVANFIGSGLVPEDQARAALSQAAYTVLGQTRKREADRVIDDAISEGVKTPRSL